MPGYGLGWIIEWADRAHNGAMDGCMGFLVRRNDGISYAVLVNTESWRGQLRVGPQGRHRRVCRERHVAGL